MFELNADSIFGAEMCVGFSGICTKWQENCTGSEIVSKIMTL